MLDDFLTQEHSDESLDEYRWEEECEWDDAESDFLDRDVEYIYPFESDIY